MGTVLLQKSSVLNDDSICVELKSKSIIWKPDRKVLEDYKIYSKSLKCILSSAIDNNNVDIDKLKELTRALINTFENNIKMLSCVNLIKDCGKYGYIHSLNVALIAIVIGRWKSYDQDKLENLALVGLLHDVGKIYNNPDKDSNIASVDQGMRSQLKERLSYKRHPIVGYEKLAEYNELDIEVLKAVLTHHERCDGSGFPLSLKEDQISELARIIGLADEYESLRQNMHIFDVIKELMSTQIGGFDTDLLIVFCSNIMNYYIGTHVLLSTGDIGEVEQIQSQAIYRPIVKTKNKVVDLYVQSQIKIEKVF